MAAPKPLAGVPKDIDRFVERSFAGLESKLLTGEGTELLAKGTFETVVPVEAIELTRVWKTINKILGPGNSPLNVLAAAYPDIASIMGRLEKIAGFAFAAGAPPSRGARARVELNKLVREMDKVKAVVEADLDRKLAAASFKGAQKTVAEQSIQGYKRSLVELQNSVKQQRDTVASLAKAGGAYLKRAERKKLVVTEILKKGNATGKAIGTAFNTLRKFGDIVTLGDALRARMAKARVKTLVDEVWHLIDPESLLFARALGIVAAVKADAKRWALFQKAAKDGIESLGKAERDSVNGTLNQLRGLLPEEASDTLGALHAMGKKRALEVMADWPKELAKTADKMSLEHVQGPFWIKGEGKLWAEFGDGATLLHDPSGGGAYLILLGESKSYLPRKLFDQIFRRSDKRFAGQIVHYIDEAGQLRSVTLKPLPGNAPPTYVFSRPQGMTEREIKELDKMVEDGMQGERELWKLDLPFRRDHNESFVKMLFEQAVATLDRPPK